MCVEFWFTQFYNIFSLCFHTTQVVGFAFDQVGSGCHSQYHETVYSLLDSLSPAYREAFGNALLRRLEALNGDDQS